MDDAFIQSLQITQGREERCSSLLWVCFSFFMLLFRSVYKELHADHETGAADNK